MTIGVVLRARDQLIVRADSERLPRAVENALRLVHVGGRQRRAQIFKAQAIRRQRRRVGLNPNRRLLSAADGDQSHARQAAKSSARARVSARSSTFESGSVSEVRASVRMGESAGLTLL